MHLYNKICLFNTLTKQIEDFKPINNEQIRMYVCGPTVYDKPHIGNARPAVVFDLLYRLLQKQYKEVIYVRNITDIDDKIIDAANAKGEKISAITEKALAEFEKDMNALNILKPTFEPKATEYVEQMCEVIKRLLEKKLAYIGNNGDVMFDVEHCPQYGCFKQLSESAESACVVGKKHNFDFVLWKNIPTDQEEKAIEHNYAWKTPDYMKLNQDSGFVTGNYGRPGWHLECTAMSVSLLGNHFDIHGGGQDLIFPHHENERAQTCGYSDEHECANYWLHNGLIQYQGGKMSKSLGNIVYLDDVCDRWSALSVRFFFLQTHYRSALNWTEEGVDLAHLRYTKIIKQLYQKYTSEESISDTATDDGMKDEIKNQANNHILAALSQDLNTSLAITIIEELIANNKISDAIAGMEMLGLLYSNGNIKAELLSWLQRKPLNQEQELLLEKRVKARIEKNYALSDQLRDKLYENGIVVEDMKEDYFWYVL